MCSEPIFCSKMARNAKLARGCWNRKKVRPKHQKLLKTFRAQIATGLIPATEKGLSRILRPANPMLDFHSLARSYFRIFVSACFISILLHADYIPGYKGIRVHYGCISQSLILKRGGFREKPSYICMKQSDLKHMLVLVLNWELNALSELQRANRWTDNTRPSSLCRQRLDLRL